MRHPAINNEKLNVCLDMYLDGKTTKQAIMKRFGLSDYFFFKAMDKHIYNPDRKVGIFYAKKYRSYVDAEQIKRGVRDLKLFKELEPFNQSYIRNYIKPRVEFQLMIDRVKRNYNLIYFEEWALTHYLVN